MDLANKHSRIRDFEAKCRREGIRLTVQRRAILEAVLDLDDHPTADRVYEALVTRAPGISRTTVYRTLETLVQMGAISKVSHPSSVVRYDPRLEKHHHLVCLRCDSVVDISDAFFDALPVPDTEVQGFEVLDARVQLRGICRRCREREEEMPSGSGST